MWGTTQPRTFVTNFRVNYGKVLQKILQMRGHTKRANNCITKSEPLCGNVFEFVNRDIWIGPF